MNMGGLSLLHPDRHLHQNFDIRGATFINKELRLSASCQARLAHEKWEGIVLYMAAYVSESYSERHCILLVEKSEEDYYIVV
jgi:hypothetical protein